MSFSGHKGAWIDYIQNAARALPQNAVVYDVFGGSGMCARAVIEARPDVKVYWNDFDNYLERLDRAPETEILRQNLQKAAGQRNSKLDYETRVCIVEIIKAHKRKYGYADTAALKNWLYFPP